MKMNCRRIEFKDECPYIRKGFTVPGHITYYKCESTPCHYAIEVLLRLLVKSKE